MATTWYYSGTETSTPPSDNYSGTNSNPNSYVNGYIFTTLSGKTIEIVSAYIENIGSATLVGITLNTTAGAILVNAGTQSIVTGWNDITLGSSYTISGSVLLWFQANQTITDSTSNLYNGQWSGPTDWPGFLTTGTGPNQDTNKCYACRLGTTGGASGPNAVQQEVWWNRTAY